MYLFPSQAEFFRAASAPHTFHVVDPQAAQMHRLPFGHGPTFAVKCCESYPVVFRDISGWNEICNHNRPMKSTFRVGYHLDFCQFWFPITVLTDSWFLYSILILKKIKFDCYYHHYQFEIMKIQSFTTSWSNYTYIFST